MEIVKAATTWAKAEIISAIFFILFGLIYILISFYFKQMGSNTLGNALFTPLLIAGALLVLAGIGFYVSNKSKLNNFEKDYRSNPASVVQAELERTESTIKTYQNVALKVFPAIMLIAAVIAFFVASPLLRAICIAVFAFLFVLVLLDSQALKRMKVYQNHLETHQVELNK